MMSQASIAASDFESTMIIPITRYRIQELHTHYALVDSIIDNLRMKPNGHLLADCCLLTAA